MPVYQFKCPECDQEHELKMKMDEVGKKTAKCPDCGHKMDRVFSFRSQLNKCSSCSGGSCPFSK